MNLILCHAAAEVERTSNSIDVVRDFATMRGTSSTYAALAALQVHVNSLASNPEPAVPIGKSVSSDFLICLDGARGGDT